MRNYTKATSLLSLVYNKKNGKPWDQNARLGIDIIDFSPCAFYSKTGTAYIQVSENLALGMTFAVKV